MATRQSVFAAIQKTMKDAALLEKLRALGVEPDVKPSPAAFADFLKNELVRWGEVARRSGARADA